MIRSLKKYIVGWLHGGPHFIVGTKENPYLLRWYLLPRNPMFNLYIHKFMRDDEDRALHDHPWPFVSFVLKGCYSELIRSGQVIFRGRFSVAFRRPTHQHRVILPKISGHPVPCWTFFVAGPRVREWGFWCPQGFRVWHEFTAPHNSGEIGRGCD